MKLAKKVLSMVLVICILLGTAMPAAATETAAKTGPKDSAVADLVNLNEVNPLPDEVTPPFVSAKDEPVLLNKENELLLYTSNRYEKSDEEAVDDFFHVFEKMDSSTSYQRDDAANNSAAAPALDLSFVTAVALDASGSGKDDYVAYLGVKAFDDGDENDPHYREDAKVLRLVLYNARTKTVVSTLQLGNVDSWIDDVPHWAYKTFFSITAGDYDGDGVDEIALTDTEMGVMVIDVKKGASSDSDLSLQAIHDFNSLVPKALADKLSITKYGSVNRRALISLATGNFDGTGNEELAVAVSSNHPGEELFLPTVPEAYTTYVSVVKQPLYGASDIQTISVYSAETGTDDDEQEKPLYHHVLYAGQITAGDVNGDRKDEVVVAGYPGTIKVDELDVIEEGPYELFGHDNDYMIALYHISLDEGKLYLSDVTKDAMTPFINEGFFDYHGAGATEFLVPLSLDAAKLHGQYSRESVFVGGKVYQLSATYNEYGKETEKFSALYTHEFFNTESSSGYTDAYVEHVTSGLFAGPDPMYEDTAMINEQFVFTVVEKQNSIDDYSYKVGFISMSMDEDGVGTFYDNTETMNRDGYLLDDLDGGVEDNYGTALVPIVADVDDDGLRVKHTRTSYFYEDPSVEAILQAAPYFDELGDWNDFSGATTYSVSVSRSLVNLWGHSHSIHAGAKGKIGSDLTGELEVKVGYALDMDFQHEKAYTTTYTTTFEAGAYDAVVVQRTPYICYEYALVDENGELLTGEDAGTVVFMEAMQPVYFQLSVDEYNQLVDEYNEMADRHDDQGTAANGTPVKTVGDNYRLVKITEDILPADTTGNPENYRSSLLDGQYISQGTYALGTNGGYTSSDFSEELEESYSAVYAHGMHFEIEGVAPTPLGVNIGAFAETSFQETCGGGNAIMNGTATGGTVANINPMNYSPAEQPTLKKYGFNWRSALWRKSLMTDAYGQPFCDSEGNELLVPVVGYVVTNVKSPMAAPDGVEAYLSGKGYQVTVDWSASPDSGDLLGYSVYRSYDNHDPVPVNEELLSPEDTSFVDTTKLKPGKIYTYFVAAHYNSQERGYKSMYSDSSLVVWGIPLFDLSEEEDELNPPTDPDDPGNTGDSDVGGTDDNPVDEKRPTILIQPNDACAEIGDLFSISFRAKGEGLSYQWYYKDASMVNFGISSNRTSAYAYTMQSYMDGRQVYCEVTDQYGNKVTTDVVTITMPPRPLELLSQPTDVHAVKGINFRVDFRVQGSGLRYQWYYKDAGMKNFSTSSNRTSAYAYTMQNYMDGRQIYCVITDRLGEQVATEIVTLHLTKE